jgi:hypothetical protein
MAPRTRKNTASKQQQSTAAKIVKKAKRNVTRRPAPGPSKVSGKKSNVLVSVNDIKTAVRLILPPGDMLNIVLNEGNRAVLNYKRSIIQAKEAKRERQTKEEETTHTKAATITKKPQEEEEEAPLMEEEGALEIADHEGSIESEDGKDEEEDSVQDLESVNDKENVDGPSGGTGGGTIASRKESHQQVKKKLMKKGAVCVGHCC